MSHKRAKYRRRMVRCAYSYLLEQWRLSKPPWWRFIAYWRWKKSKPMEPKGAKKNHVN